MTGKKIILLGAMGAGLWWLWKSTNATGGDVGAGLAGMVRSVGDVVTEQVARINQGSATGGMPVMSESGEFIVNLRDYLVGGDPAPVPGQNYPPCMFKPPIP